MRLFIPVGPVPFPLVGSFLMQLEEQGWKPEWVTYAGKLVSQVVVPGRPQQQTIAFLIVASREKDYAEKEVPVPTFRELQPKPEKKP